MPKKGIFAGVIRVGVMSYLRKGGGKVPVLFFLPYTCVFNF
jgi:hypothetical protein